MPTGVFVFVWLSFNFIILFRYIAECAPESHRGQMATLWQLAITTGIVLVSILNIWLAEWDEGWRISYAGNCVFSVLLLGLLTIMPESPHFLVRHNRDEEAEQSLLKTRFEDQVSWELEELKLEAEEANEMGVASWSEVFDDSNNKMKTRTLTGVLLQTFQQLSGINAVMFYAPNILSTFFGSTASIYGALALNVVNFFSTFITIFSVERWGRVWLLFTGGILMFLALIPNAVLSSIPDPTQAMGKYRTAASSLLTCCSIPLTMDILSGVGVILCCALYVVGFAYSWGPVVWVVCAEMFPMRERGKANSLTTFSNWFWTTVVGAVFPHASSASLAGCFGFFAAVVFVATIVSSPK